jgi:hypothetical protein
MNLAGRTRRIISGLLLAAALLSYTPSTPTPQTTLPREQQVTVSCSEIIAELDKRLEELYWSKYL